jgi:hypothetical protein
MEEKMTGNEVAQIILQSSRVKTTIMLVLICGILNIGTDMSIGIVPGFGDVANTLIDTVLVILQVGSVMYLRSHGIEYTPKT